MAEKKRESDSDERVFRSRYAKVEETGRNTENVSPVERERFRAACLTVLRNARSTPSVDIDSTAEALGAGRNPLTISLPNVSRWDEVLRNIDDIQLEIDEEKLKKRGSVEPAEEGATGGPNAVEEHPFIHPHPTREEEPLQGARSKYVVEGYRDVPVDSTTPPPPQYDLPPPSYESAVKGKRTSGTSGSPDGVEMVSMEFECGKGIKCYPCLSVRASVRLRMINDRERRRRTSVPRSFPHQETTFTSISREPESETEAVTTDRVEQPHSDDVDTAERGATRSRQIEVDNFATRKCPWMKQPCTRVARYLSHLTVTKVVVLVALVTGIIGLVLFLGLFPSSFVYVEYHELALKQSKLTNVVDRDHVYYPGCYVLGPDSRFIKFNGAAHDISMTLSVFTIDTISIEIQFSIQYFIRPGELGQLHADFEKDYDEVIRKIVIATVRVQSATKFSVDDYRYNRFAVEDTFLTVLKRKLEGICCPECCYGNGGCKNSTTCMTCDYGDRCSQGYHVDIRYFFMRGVSIPDAVFERYLRRTLLVVEAQREVFIQNHTLTEKETERQTKQIKNEANEVRTNGTVVGAAIGVNSAADYEKTVQTSYIRAVKNMCNSLNIVKEEHILSMMMIRALEDVSDNLYNGYNFNTSTLYKPVS